LPDFIRPNAVLRWRSRNPEMSAPWVPQSRTVSVKLLLLNVSRGYYIN
jgi:hypothetical protein